MDVLTKNMALEFLRKSLLNKNISFREGQYEAIDAVVNKRKKVLVVQKTGWGKSIVYFISTKFLRQCGYGLTIIISPLLALMRNQIESAKKLGLNISTINSSNIDHWNEVKSSILSDKVDALLISPERLANEDFMQNILEPISGNIGLFVIDEAHCISDWGHDFRPDYKRIVNILKQIPENTPILATTATANDRVIEDIKSQINGILIMRGDLKRESLSLHNIRLPHPSYRLAWLAKYIPLFEGSGIVYVLTQRDAKIVSDWLNENNISASPYFSDVTNDKFETSDAYREFLEDQLINNNVKVLVATSALGMGFDKSDIGFVIHYQAPGSIIGYYQQVGRAGRGIDNAYGILLSGHEDDDIHDFFRRSSFPTKENIDLILECLERSNMGLSIVEIQKELNLTQGEVEKTLKYLSVEPMSPVIKRNSKWFRTLNKYFYDEEKINKILEIRHSEWDEIQKYLDTKECLMSFLQKALNDPSPQKCGKCANCLQPIGSDFSTDIGLKAVEFLRKKYIDFTPKKQVRADALSTYGIRGKIPEVLRAENGRILSRWEDAGWGRIVAENKHNGKFSDELVNAFVEMVHDWNQNFSWVTCIPSLKHPVLVPEFAQKVANKLNLPFIQAIKKIKQNQAQKMMNNSYHQAKNLDGVFEVGNGIPNKPVLLIDDIIDSGWTITVAAMLLKQKGCGNVFPVALSTTGKL